MKGFAWIALFSLIGHRTQALNPNKLIPPVIMDTEDEALEVWHQMELNMKNGIDSILKQILPTVLSSSGEVDIEPECMGDLMKVVFGVKKLELWALEVLDSTGKPSSGLLMASTSALGHYEECLSVVFPQNKNDPDELTSTGQYCLAEVQIPVPPKPKRNYLFLNPFRGFNSTFQTEIMEHTKKLAFLFYLGGLRLGVCIPSSCSQTDFQNMLDAVGKQVNIGVSVYSCETKHPFSMDPVQKTIAALITTILIVVGICSILDFFGWPSQIVSAFSLQRNFIGIFETKESTGHILEPMNGIRVITMIWVILAHTYSTLEPHLARSALNIENMRQHVSIQIIINAYVSIQTFIVLSGVLVAYNLIKAYDGYGSVVYNVPVLIIKRIWRLLPSELLLMGVGILFPLLGSGPLYQDTATFIADNCRNSWWYHLIFINNVLGPDKACFPHTFYLAIDLQLFLLALVYFYIFIKKPNLATPFLIAIATLSIAATGCVVYIFDLLPTNLVTSVVDIDYTLFHSKVMYTSTYPQISTFAIGLWLGTFIARNDKLKLSKLVVVFGWLTSATVAMALLFGVHSWNAGTSQPNLIETLLYGSLYRPLWGASIAWVILACGYGYSGYVGDLLSWSGFQPMVKISFLMYLFHAPVLFFYTASLQGPIDTKHTTLVWLFMGNLGITMLACVGIRVLFEAPFVQFDKIFFAKLAAIKNRNQDEGTANDAITKPDLVMENGSYVPDKETSNL